MDYAYMWRICHFKGESYYHVIECIADFSTITFVLCCASVAIKGWELFHKKIEGFIINLKVRAATQTSVAGSKA